MPFMVWVLMVKALGVDWAWMPLPTRPQRYCDPASLVYVVLAENFFSEMKAKVDALIVTTPDGFFVCNECRYGSKSEEHVREHIELHIEGFSHKCRTCNRVFTKRTSFKFHMSKCQKK